MVARNCTPGWRWRRARRCLTCRRTHPPSCEANCGVKKAVLLSRGFGRLRSGSTEIASFRCASPRPSRRHFALSLFASRLSMTRRAPFLSPASSHASRSSRVWSYEHALVKRGHCTPLGPWILPTDISKGYFDVDISWERRLIGCH